MNKAMEVDIAAPFTPIDGINKRFKTTTNIIIPAVKDKSYRYFLDVTIIVPFKPQKISMIFPIIKYKKISSPLA